MKFRVLVITVLSIFLISCNNGSEDNTSFTEIDAPAEISERAYTGGKLVENSIKDYDTYISFLLDIHYGEVTITFDVYLSKKDNIEEPIIKFIPVKEEL